MNPLLFSDPSSDAQCIGPLDFRADTDSETMTNWGAFCVAILMDMGVLGGTSLPAATPTDPAFFHDIRTAFRHGRDLCRTRIQALQHAEDTEETDNAEGVDDPDGQEEPETGQAFRLNPNVSEDDLRVGLARIWREMGLRSFYADDITTIQDILETIYVLTGEFGTRISTYRRSLTGQEWTDLDGFFLRALVILADAQRGCASETTDTDAVPDGDDQEPPDGPPSW